MRILEILSEGQPFTYVLLIAGALALGAACRAAFTPVAEGTRASLAMQLAETLGIAFEDVTPTVVDTDSVGYNDVTAGSRVTFGTGMAVHEAGKNLVNEMKQRLAPNWKVTPEDIEFEDGNFSTKDGAHSGAFKDVAVQLCGRGIALTVSGSVNAGFLAGGGFAHAIVDVEVDPDTGKVSILRYTAIQDAGTAVHPA